MARDITIGDYETFQLTNEALRELCLDNLDMSFEELVKVLSSLHKLMKSLDGLSIDRFDSMVRLTEKKDVLDCAYVRKALIFLLRDLDKWDQMLVLLKDVEV
jgi:hypothetical protein